MIKNLKRYNLLNFGFKLMVLNFISFFVCLMLLNVIGFVFIYLMERKEV